MDTVALCREIFKATVPFQNKSGLKSYRFDCSGEEEQNETSRNEEAEEEFRSNT